MVHGAYAEVTDHIRLLFEIRVTSNLLYSNLTRTVRHLRQAGKPGDQEEQGRSGVLSRFISLTLLNHLASKRAD